MGSILGQGWRSWKSAKGVALLAICALAIGIGSTTAIYTVVQTVLLKPLGYTSPERWVGVFGRNRSQPKLRNSFSYQTAREMKTRTRAFDAFGCYVPATYNLTSPGQPQRVSGADVDPALANQLGVNPERGRWFRLARNEPGGLSVVVISHTLWTRLGADPNLVGGALTINDRKYTVTGVMPAWFRLPADQPHNEVWIPLDPLRDQAHGSLYFCSARLAPGVGLQQADADVKRVAAELERELPAENTGQTAVALALLGILVEEIRPTLLLLLGAAVLLLLITCANVAGLMLARSVGRARETALRVALGAAVWQMGTAYFMEGLLVSLAGAAAGALLSVLLVRTVLRLAAEYIPRADEVALNSGVLWFAIGTAVLAALLFSLAPLWQAMRTSPSEVLSDGTRSSAGARSTGLLRWLVVSEIALAFILLSGSGLLLAQLGILYRVRPGFDADHVLTMQLYASDTKYAGPALAPYQKKLIDSIERVPSVESAGFISLLPMVAWGWTTRVFAEGRPVTDVSKADDIEFRVASPGYWKAMRIPLRAGRLFNEGDTQEARLPAIINENLAKLYWPGGNAVGSYAHISDPRGSRMQIIGVVGDVRAAGLDNPVRPELYLPHLIVPSNDMTMVVRSPLDPTTLSREVVAAIHSVNPEQPVFSIQTMAHVVDSSQALSRQRLQSFMVSLFALAAVLMAMLGVYGVVSYAVRQRTVEIGTRMALGATSRDLLRLVMGDGLRMAVYGVAIGAVASVALALLLSENVFGIPVADPRPFLVSTAIVAGMTLLACTFPAWRATLVSPMVAIRNEPGSFWQGAKWGYRHLAGRIAELAWRGDPEIETAEAALLAQIVEASRTAVSFPEAIHAALSTLRKEMSADSAVLLVQRVVSQPYRCAAAVPDTCGNDWVLPADSLLVSRLRRYPSALPITSGDLDAWSRWAVEQAPQRLREIACLQDLGVHLAVPVALNGEVAGLLLLGRPAGRGSYSALQRRVLRGVAAQMALLIENSRLTERIVEQERLRRELLLAGEVQKRLFPERAPLSPSLQLAGVCLPARGVGGDYYDFLDLGERQIGIALADVAGKGIAAALLMSVVQASLRSLADLRGVSLADLAARMNRLLHRSTGSSSYATFFYAQVDENGRRLRYVNAGHNPPFLLRAGSTKDTPIEELAVGGTIIGMFAQSSYEEGAVDLHPGDILMAFSDGVPEALNPADEEFGEERVKELLRAVAHLPVDDMASRVLNELKNWISDAAQYDDLTFLLMKIL